MDTFLTNTFYIQLAQIIISVVVIATILRFLAIPIAYTGVGVGFILSSFDLDLISLEQDFNLYMNIGIFYILAVSYSDLKCGDKNEILINF